MIDLTPLDVRNKRGDFKRLMRGYDPQEVDVFLELVAERLEDLVRENIQLKERTVTLQKQVESQAGREQAVQDALVTAQALRADIQAQSQREADHALREAEAEARRILADADSQVRAKLGGIERRFEGALDGLSELERRRQRFLKDFRSLLQRELDVVAVEEERKPLEDRTIDLDLGAWWSPSGRVLDKAPDDAAASPASAPEPEASERAGPEAAARGSIATGDEGSAQGRRPEPRRGGPGREGSGSPTAEARTEPRADAVGLAVAPDSRPSVPSQLETPSFAKRRRDAGEGPYDELSAAMEAEALAQAGSEVVEVTGADADHLEDVPRLEQVLAEAGAELVEVKSQAPRRAEKIEPPRPEDEAPASGPQREQKRTDR